MNTLQNELNNDINELALRASAEQLEQLNILRDQLNDAISAGWTADELGDLLKTDDDIVDSGLFDETEIHNIRNIQDSIITGFGA